MDMLIMVCFYHYAQGVRVNPPPLGFVFNVCDPRIKVDSLYCALGFWNWKLFFHSALYSDFSP